MVLDLVVQAAEREVGEPATAHIAGSERLAAQEVALIGGVQDGHALVVGGEGAPQVEAEQALLDDDEDHGLDGREHKEHRGADGGPAGSAGSRQLLLRKIAPGTQLIGEPGAAQHGVASAVK